MNEQYFRDEWKDFRKFEREEHDKILKKLDSVEEKVESLKEWRARMTGINIAVSFFVSVFGVFLLSHLMGK